MILGTIVDSFAEIIRRPNSSNAQTPVVNAFTELRDKFDASVGFAKSLLVIHVDDGQKFTNESERLTNQQQVTEQLKLTCGRAVPVAPIGESEYALLLLGYDQCSELIPRLENMIARAKAGHLNGDGRSLLCRIGVARSPIDTEDLRTAIAMASAAASELLESDLSFQFISRRHNIRMH